ncbi:MAG: inositol monophosphatase [Gemmatales bacterium]|nr:MAG: inositol monophosphatase [Gemmatales bacterium]
MQEEFNQYLESAQEAALRGAAVLQEWRQKFRVREKGRFDLVTDADLASQRTIRQYLQERFPEHQFLGEEEGADTLRPRADSPPTWICDPLDGTTNYVHDCPLFAVSLGLLVAGELVVGVVYDPSRQEMFSAAKGMGAWLNGERIQTSSTSRLEEALLATGFPHDLRGHEDTLDWWCHFSLRARSLRRTGSTAINLAYVAAGRFDAYWGFDAHVWDVSGGVVLVREAGGVVTNCDGSSYDPFTPDGLATNGPLHPLMLAELKSGPKKSAPLPC